MMFNQRPHFFHRCGINIIYHLYRVRIAHGNHANGHDLAVDLQRILDGIGIVSRISEKRNLARSEARCAHVGCYHAISGNGRRDDAFHGFNANFSFVGEALRAHELRKTMGTISTLLDFAAVAVKNPVAKIDIRQRRFLNQQKLIAADAEI